MLYIYYGTDETIAREKARGLLKALQIKAPDAELIRVTDDCEHIDAGTIRLEALLGAQGLFKQNYLLYFDRVDAGILGFSDIQLEAMKQSSHVCVVLMGKLTVKQCAPLKQWADKITEYTLPKSSIGQQKFNVFSVANALKDKNKQRLWKSLTDARLAGSEGEAITGMLFWAVKDMIVKKQFRIYSEKELHQLALHLAELPHKARHDAVSIHNALERFALSSI